MSVHTPTLAGWTCATALLITGCGGGGGGDGNGGGGPPLNIAAGSLRDGVVGSTYLDDVVASGGSGQKTYSLSGDLPAGLALDPANGNINGTPSGPAGESSFTVNVADSATPAQTDSQAFTIRIADPLAVDAGTPPMAAVGVAYSHEVSVSGGIPPYLISAGLPDGLSVDADGVISGTPTSDARTPPGGGLVVFDSAVPQQEASVSLLVRVELEVATAAMPDAIAGVSYSAQLEAQGGLPDFQWEMTGGNLPLFVYASGFMSGTPDQSCDPASHVLDVRVTDSDSPAQVATRNAITLDVLPRAVGIPDSTAPPVATLGQPYEFRLSLLPGVAPFVFTVAAGALPPGIVLNAGTGALSGTPTTAGSYDFTLSVSDQCGNSDSKSFTIIVRDAARGRNDSIATATPVGNGSIVASISPSGHPNSLFSPDEDYYRVEVSAASTITVDLEGLGGGIDTVVELVSSGGGRLGSCRPPDFIQVCMNDDRAPGNLDSLLEVRINSATTFYIHVVEWRGDARPDLRYRLSLSGVN